MPGSGVMVLRCENLQSARVAYGVVMDYLAERDALRRADAIVAFGGRDLTVAVQAALLQRAGWAPWIVASGGAPFDDRRTEAEAFADHMAAVGVPRGRILVEPCSRHTGENVRFALDLLNERMEGLRSVIAVPRPFAARRAVATLRHQAPDLDVISAPDRMGPDGRRPFGPRAVRIALAELDRLDRYVHAGFLGVQSVPESVRAAATVLAAASGVADGAMTAV